MAHTIQHISHSVNTLLALDPKSSQGHPLPQRRTAALSEPSCPSPGSSSKLDEFFSFADPAARNSCAIIRGRKCLTFVEYTYGVGHISYPTKSRLKIRRGWRTYLKGQGALWYQKVYL